MSAKQSSEMASYIKSKKNVLLMTGDLCDKIDLDGKLLSDYAASIAKNAKLPVAATGVTVKSLKAKGVETAAHKYAAEIVDFTRGAAWRDPLMAERPELLVLIGYSPVAAAGLVSAAENVETAVLGNVYSEEATYSLPDASLSQYQQNLEQLVSALGS